MTPRQKRVIIVGAGMAGLTAGVYLLRAGLEVLILEQSPGVGGLVQSFNREGFVFDTGPRAIGNAGILKPLLEDLGIELPMVKGLVSTGIKDQIVHYDTPAGVEDFIASLHKLFPEEGRAIGKISRRIRSWSRVSQTLNQVPNPFFRNVFADPGFFLTRFLPLMPRFLAGVVRMALSHRSIEADLAAFSRNQALNDLVSQHYFKGTPAPFAFGYFENFQDYLYPLGGTGQLPRALAERVTATGGQIRTGIEVVQVDPAAKTLRDQHGATYPYDALLWAADLKSLYRRLNPQGLAPGPGRRLARRREALLPLKVGESVFTLFLGVDQPPEAFAALSRGHLIYTPRTKGLGELHRGTLESLKAGFDKLSQQEILAWVGDFCRYNSYEISLPVLKDPRLAPSGRTGLVVSLLIDGELFEQVDQAGWSALFRQALTDAMLDTLESSLYPDLRSRLLFADSATPLTLSRRFGTSQGAITGWSLEHPIPVPRQLTSLHHAPRTDVKGIYQAGQWTYSPAGVPIALLTGRVAAEAIRRAL